MFFCEACRVKNSWPSSMLQSQGPCELCKKVALCHDVQSKFLPIAQQFVPSPPLNKDLLRKEGDIKVDAWLIIEGAAGRMRQDPSLRFGQALFNTLESLYPELADEVRGTEYDPYHLDYNKDRDKVSKFWRKVTEYALRSDSEGAGQPAS